jgi:uncharacterized phiE125 gp8 family phage protein
MRVTVITPPAPIVSWDEARAHLRLDDGDDQQSYVESLIAAAQANIDGPAGWLGRCLGVQTLEMRGWDFGFCDRLPYPPVINVLSVAYVDPAGAEQTLVSAEYQISSSGFLEPSYGVSWPQARYERDAVRIRYRAGYEEIPAPIKHAVLLMVSHWFNNRDAVTTTAAQPAVLPMGVEALLAPYRVGAV